MSDCRHQCRYCAWCIVTIDDFAVCEHDKVQTPERGDHIPYSFNRPNKCPYWHFNEIAADFFGDNNKVYKPRKKSPYTQGKLFEMQTDKQRARGRS